MSATAMTDPAPTYGGWRRSRGLEVYGQGSTSLTVIGLAITITLAAGLFAGPAKAGLTVLALIPVVATAVATRHGEPLLRVVARRVRFAHATARGWTLYRSEAVEDLRLPGPLAATRLVGATSATGGRFGIVRDENTGLMTPTLRCASTSTALVDPREADAWVANWHGWLADLGYLPSVSWVNVTVDTAPEPGTTLADYVDARIDQGAPEDARDLLLELVRCSPGAAADVDTRVSVTFDPAAAQAANPARAAVAGRWLMAQFGVKRGTGWTPDLTAQIADVDRTLTGMESALGSCGVSVLGRATAADLAGIVRTAYDPTSRGEVARVIDAAHPDDRLTWDDAGPVGADEGWDRYHHDSGWSVTYAWVAPPGQVVHSSVLTRLVAPGKFPKRVAMLYRARTAEDAAAVLEQQVNLAAFRDAHRRATGREETARDRQDKSAASQAAAEEARGAGVVLMTMYVTVTVTDEGDLPAAMAEVEARARHSKIRLRVMRGSQAAGFTATLPAGVHPQHLAARGRA